MKNKIITLLVGFFAIASAYAVDTATLRITKNDKSIENKVVQLEKISENVSRLLIKKEDIDKKTIYEIDFIADCATAKKGDKGFWIMNRGMMGKFLNDNGYVGRSFRYLDLPYFAMKSPKGTFIGVIDGLRFECEVRAEAKDGNYEIYPKFRIHNIGFDPYEDINITFYKLPKSAGYVEMAKAFRKHRQSTLPELKPMKERFKTQPLLEEQTKVIALRMSFANKQITLPREVHKKTDYTRENEPKIRARPFSSGTEILKAMKAAGVENIWVCTEGWQSGGYDGRTPDTWPICPEAGGEEELKKFIKAGQELGYLIDAHMDYSDCYTCAEMWTPDMVCKSPWGTLDINGAWAGGKAYNLCLDYAWKRWIPEELEKIRGLGFQGGLFIDVFTAVYPYRCCDPKHPITRKQSGDYQKKISKRCRELFGVIGSECAFDYYIDQLDFINYPSISEDDILRKMNDPVAETGPRSLNYVIVPFWELAYHDCVISTPFRQLVPQNMYSDPKKADSRLKLAEFCGRPIFYATDLGTVKHAKDAFDFYKRYRHLTAEEMTDHKKIAKGVTKTKFANGSEIIVNYTNKPFNYNGRVIVPAKDFVVLDK